MEAIFVTGGKQHLVTEGSVIYAEKIDAEVGKEVTFTDVLMVDGTFGTPYVEGAKVVCEVENLRQALDWIEKDVDVEDDVVDDVEEDVDVVEDVVDEDVEVVVDVVEVVVEVVVDDVVTTVSVTRILSRLNVRLALPSSDLILLKSTVA